MGDEDSMQELDEAYNEVPTRYRPIEADTPSQNFNTDNNIIKYKDSRENLRRDPWDLKEERSISRSPDHNSFSYNGVAQTPQFNIDPIQTNQSKADSRDNTPRNAFYTQDTKRVNEIKVQKISITPKVALNPKKVQSVPKIIEKVPDDEMASFSGGESPKRGIFSGAESPKRGMIMSDTETEQQQNFVQQQTTPRVIPSKNFGKSPQLRTKSPRVGTNIGFDISGMSMGSGGGLSSQMNIEHLDQIQELIQMNCVSYGFPDPGNLRSTKRKDVKARIQCL